MDRRTFLRTALVAGAAGCTRTAPDPVAGASGSPTPATTGLTPPTATPTPSPTSDPVAAPSPGPVSAARRVRPAASRELLGLPAPGAGGQAHSIEGLMLHHTAAPTATAAAAPDRFRSHTRAHRDAGFVDVAYHWGVDVAGNVYQLRDEGLAGETFTDYDPAGWLLVVCEGNFEESEPPQPMLEAVADVFAARAAALDVAPSTLVGHRDVAATACPGRHLQARLGALTTMIEERMATHAVALEVTDDPAALP